jgi:hypothetical protein
VKSISRFISQQVDTRLAHRLKALLLGIILGVADSRADDPAESAMPSLEPYLGHWEVDFSATESANEKLRFLYDVTLSEHKRRLANSQNGLGDTPFQAANDLQGLVNLGRLADQITRTAVLNIQLVDGILVAARDDNFSLRCAIGGAQTTVQSVGISQCHVQAKALVFSMAMPGGLRIEHRLILSKQQDRLSIATTLAADGVSQSFSVSRVFQPFEPGDPGFACRYTLGKGRVCQLNGTPDE